MVNGNREIVYVLTNQAMPGLTKIGKTTRGDLQTRLNELYTTGVPVPFDCVYACEVENCSAVEQAFHTGFGDHRVNPKREFFSIEPERVIAILQLVALADITPQVEGQLSAGLDSEDKQARESLRRAKRPRMNFAEMGIPAGARLVFRNDPSIEVIVEDDRHVLWHDESCSLTKATAELLGIAYQVQPSPYWTYDGRVLKDIYEDTYAPDGE